MIIEKTKIFIFADLIKSMFRNNVFSLFHVYSIYLQCSYKDFFLNCMRSWCPSLDK